MIYRLYQCKECEAYFECEFESGTDPDPECPACNITLDWRPTKFNIGTNKGKSIDVAQKIISEDFNVTNLRDNQREGDIAFMGSAPTREETDAKEKLAHQMREFAAQSETPRNPQLEQTVKGFFGGGQLGASIDIGQALAAARTGPGAYTKDHNPITMLHNSGAKGLLPNNRRIIAKA